MEYLWSTDSTDDQRGAEKECRPFFVNLLELDNGQVEHLRNTGLLPKLNKTDFDVCLLYQAHSTYLHKAFGTLPAGFVSLDASRPWMLYWTLHGCDLLGELPKESILKGIFSTLQACWSSSNDGGGGFGGGPGQMAHCATTYAAVLALSIIATTKTTEDNQITDLAKHVRNYMKDIQQPLLTWFSQLLEPKSGGYRMHVDGEVDVRATYTIVTVAKLLKLPFPQLESPTVISFLQACQTYEGGFGGEPGSEAHGGYTFCAIAALQLLGHLNDDTVDIAALRGWLVRRQMAYEGGFQGRCNKLVDGCYSFWQGSAQVILASQSSSKLKNDPWLSQLNKDGKAENMPELLFHEGMLQRYILLCAQDVNGGLRDKPSKPRDFYHSCYNLSGLSVSQHYGVGTAYGHPTSSIVAVTHPCYNIRIDRVRSIIDFFEQIATSKATE